MLVPSALLPMPGRPATMIRSDGCMPPILLLRLSSPVVRPDRWPPLLSARSAISSASRGRLAERLGLAVGSALLGDPVELGLGLLDLRHRGDLLAGVERILDQLAADPDQRAQQGEVVDLLGEIARADHRRARSGELGEIGRAADLLHPLVGVEQRPQRDRIGDSVGVGHPEDGFVDAAVQRLEEMVRAKLELDVLDQPVVDHQRPEERRLGLDILGERRGSGRSCRLGDTNDFCHDQSSTPVRPHTRRERM